MATTDKSTKQLNSNAQSAPSTTSKTQDSEENFSEALPWLVPGKLYYAKTKDWNGDEVLVLVQFVKLKDLARGQARDADVNKWICKTYVTNGSTAYIPILYVKVEDLLDKDFVDGELYKCLI
jgi:hypothetical protein